MNGYYKTTIATKASKTRLETALEYISTTTWNNTEYWGLKNTENCYINIGRWAKEINPKQSNDYFDIVVIFENDNVIEFWYVDEVGTIKKVYE